VIQPLYFSRYEPAVMAVVDAAMTYSAVGYNAGAAALATYDVRARLAEIVAPTLLITGDDDWITPPEQGALRVAAGIRHARVARFANCGHYPFIEEPERFVRLLGDWLDGLPK
jgi:pimeloyl-ACP methyl ester carboxylesterase